MNNSGPMEAMAEKAIPTWLSGTYRRYKDDTKVLTSWLATTAVNFGYPLQGPPVNVQGLLNQAEFLATRPPEQLKIPNFVIHNTRTAIRARTQCSEWYRSSTRSLESENSGHQNFTDTLRKILEILEPIHMLREVIDSAKQEPNADKLREEKLISSFKLLEVQECLKEEELEADDFENAQGPSHRLPKRRFTPKGKKGKGKSRTDPNWQSNADWVFDQYNNMCSYMIALWKHYWEGHVDLSVVAAVIEIAFLCMEELEQDKLCPVVGGKQWNSAQVTKALITRDCRTIKADLPEMHQAPSLEYLRKAADHFYNWKPHLDQCMVGQPMLRKDVDHWLDCFDESKEWRDLTIGEQAAATATDLFYLVSETAISGKFENSGYQLPIQDRVTRRIRQMVRQNETSIESASLLCQIDLLKDIQALMRPHVDFAYTTLRSTTEHTQKYMGMWRNFLTEPWLRDLVTDLCSKNNRKQLWGLKPLLKNVETDNLQKKKLTLYEERGHREACFATTANTPFSRNPALCGLYELGAKLLVTWRGVEAVNKLELVMDIVHLYNALAANKYLSYTWPQMERLIQVQGKHYLFFGGAPKDLSTCKAKVRLSRGVSLRSTSTVGRGLATKFEYTRPSRKLKMGPVSDAFKTYLLDEQKDPNAGRRLVAHLQELMKKSGKHREKLDDDFECRPLLDFTSHSLMKELQAFECYYLFLNTICLVIHSELHDKFKQVREDYAKEGYDMTPGLKDCLVEDLIEIGVIETWDAAQDGVFIRGSKTLRRVADVMEKIIDAAENAEDGESGEDENTIHAGDPKTDVEGPGAYVEVKS